MKISDYIPDISFYWPSVSAQDVPPAMVIGNAEIISALCLIQLAYPGTPVVYCFLFDILNPITGNCWASAPQKPAFHGAIVQLGHHYDLPVMTYYGASDTDTISTWQTGKDNAIDALYVCLTGPELIPTMGLSQGYTLLYPEKILFDSEIFNSIKHTAAGIQVNSETLALDEIKGVAPGGHFLDTDYTCINMRKLWQPGITRQWSSDKSDFVDLQKAALEKIKWILANHKPKPFDESAKKEIKTIIKAAENKMLPR